MTWFDTKPRGQRKLNLRGPHWKQQDGSLVLIASMTDDHLRNALRLLHRLTDAWSWLQAMTPPLGEHAQDAHGDWCEELAIKKPTDLLRAGPHKDRAEPLLKEWAKRSYAEDTWDDGSRGRLAVAMFDRIFPKLQEQPVRPIPTAPDPVEGCDCIDCSIAGEATH